MAKTTLNIDDALLRNAKRAAADGGTTLTAVVEQALRAALLPGPVARDFRLQWRTVRGHEAPAFDIADRDALHDAMERDR